MEMSMINTVSDFSYQNQRRNTEMANPNGFKRSDTLSLDAASNLHESADEAIPANPYSIDQVSDEAWQTYVKATKGFEPMATEATQKLLFEEEMFVNTMSDALSLLDWSKRADALKENIILPQSNATDIPETQKRMIADQMKLMINAQTKILDNFSFLAQNGGPITLNLVA
jgi:hypothetical protein